MHKSDKTPESWCNLKFNYFNRHIILHVLKHGMVLLNLCFYEKKDVKNFMQLFTPDHRPRLFTLTDTKGSMQKKELKIITSTLWNL